MERKNKPNFFLVGLAILLVGLMVPTSLAYEANEGLNERLREKIKIDDEGILVEQESGVDPLPRNEVFFNGEGFIISVDESAGEIIELSILRNEDTLTGKAVLGSSYYRVNGVIDKTRKVQLEITPLEEDNSLNKEFSGALISLENVNILKGRLVDGPSLDSKDNSKIFELYAFSKKSRLVSSSGHEKISTRVGDLIVLDEKIPSVSNKDTESISSSGNAKIKEAYIRPIKIEKEKILGFIPNPWGKETVKVEVATENKVSSKNIRQGSSKEIQGYKIEVESIDEENIGLKVS